MENDLSPRWLKFVELISDDQYEFEQLLDIFRKQLTKLNNFNILKSEEMVRKKSTMMHDLNAESKLLTANEIELRAKKTKKNSRRGGKNKRLGGTMKTKPVPEKNIVQSSLRYLQNLFAPNKTTAEIEKKKTIENDPIQKKRFQIDNKNPLKVTFQKYLREDGRFYKNERELENQSFFDDLNYGELIVKFQNYDYIFNSEYSHSFRNFGESFKFFLESVNIISDEHDISQFYKKNLFRRRKDMFF